MRKEWASKGKYFLQSSLMGMELLNRAAVNFEYALQMIPEAHLKVTAADMIWSMETITDEDGPQNRQTKVKR